MGDADGSWGAEPHQTHPALCSSQWPSTLQSPVDRIPQPPEHQSPHMGAEMGEQREQNPLWVGVTHQPHSGGDPSFDAHPAANPCYLCPVPLPERESAAEGTM